VRGNSEKVKRCGCFARRRRLLRIVRNSLWLFLTHLATPPFPQKSRSVRLLGCKRPHNGSLSLPTFADLRREQAPPYALNKYAINREVPLPDEGAVERSETEGVKKITLNYKKLPQAFFCEKMPAPSDMGRKHKPNLI
jgi:hypothetical protein